MNITEKAKGILSGAFNTLSGKNGGKLQRLSVHQVLLHQGLLPMHRMAMQKNTINSRLISRNLL